MYDDEPNPVIEAIADEVEELEVQVPRRELALMLEHRGRDLAPGAPGRAAWLCHAGGSWELADEPDRARACYEEAVADGGPAWVDARAALVMLLFDLGETARADALVDELRADLAAGRRLRGPVHDYVGEALELHGRPEEALRWYNSGLARAGQEERDEDETGCLNGRFRVRRALGLPRDRYDELAEEARREAVARLTPDDEAPVELPSWEPPARLAVLFWPAGQLDQLLHRWPAMREDYGSAVAEHRAIVERHLRRIAAHGGQVSIAPGTVEEYVAFAERKDQDPAEAATRAAFAAHLGFLGRTTRWPPRRNEPCWCGSGVKYKKCCGGLRFPAGDGEPEA